MFADAPPGRRSAASMVRIESTGRLLMCFSHVIGVDLRNQAALVVTRSDDDGATWAEPLALYAYPGWFSLAMGGLARIADDNVKVMLGRILIDLSLGGTEPMTGWYVASTTTRDGGDELVGPVARDPALPGVDGALRREQPASARRRPPPLGGHGHLRPRLRLARRGERQRRRGRAHRAAHDHRRGGRPGLQRHRRDPARRRPLPGRRPRAPDPPERHVATRPTRAGPGHRSCRRRSSARTSSCSGCGPGRSPAPTATRTPPGAASA